jgi:hypothetical protein
VGGYAAHAFNVTWHAWAFDVGSNAWAGNPPTLHPHCIIARLHVDLCAASVILNYNTTSTHHHEEAGMRITLTPHRTTTEAPDDRRLER